MKLTKEFSRSLEAKDEEIERLRIQNKQDLDRHQEIFNSETSINHKLIEQLSHQVHKNDAQFH